MAGEPIFGDDTPVPVLDWGQRGGTLFASGDVQSTCSVAAGPVRMFEVDVPLPEIHALYTSVCGFGGQRVTITGVMRAETNAKLVAVESEIHTYRTGFARNFTTGMTEVTEETLIKALPSKLVDVYGNVLGMWFRLKEFAWQSPRHVAASGHVVQRYLLAFESLG